VSTELIVSNYRRIRVELGSDPYASVLEAIREVERNGVRPLRVNAHDWLTLADISARLGVSRELVRLWSIGQQGPGRFPPPLNPDSATSFYSWAEVSVWVRRHTRYGPETLDEPALIAMNLALQLRSMAHRITSLDAVVNCILRQEGGSPTR
jgi:hypothetical protein